MKITVVGVGGMGEPLAWALQKLGAEVFIGDICEDTLERVHQRIGCEKTYSQIEEDGFALDHEVDLVFSCAPYSVTGAIATECASRNIRYCDLGGNPEVSDKIHNMFKNNDYPCFTDLGLAPGYVNILAESVCSQIDKIPQTVEMYVGGLPADPNNTLNYNLVFHAKGLWNELTGDCEIIRDGKKEIVRALQEVSDLPWESTDDKLEVAHTKGGLASSLDLMFDRGVQNCSYQTIRFTGHYDYMNFLLQECDLCNDYETFEKIISASCPRVVKDKVFIKVRVDDFEVESVIDSDEEWTAMQKGTAFPAAVVAFMMASGELDESGPVLNYSHIHFYRFATMLEGLL